MPEDDPKHEYINLPRSNFSSILAETHVKFSTDEGFLRRPEAGITLDLYSIALLLSRIADAMERKELMDMEPNKKEGSDAGK